MKRHALADLTKRTLKKILIHFGVKSIPAGIAAHFIFKYIFKPIAHYLIRKEVVLSYAFYSRHEKPRLVGVVSKRTLDERET